MALNRALIDLLVCPKCHGGLRLTEPQDGLICEPCQLVYPIVDDIPTMIIEEAIPQDQWPEKQPSKG